MRNIEDDLKALELLKTKDWFNNSKGNMDLLEMTEWYINKTIEMKEALISLQIFAEQRNQCSIYLDDISKSVKEYLEQ